MSTLGMGFVWFEETGHSLFLGAQRLRAFWLRGRSLLSSHGLKHGANSIKRLRLMRSHAGGECVWNVQLYLKHKTVSCILTIRHTPLYAVNTIVHESQRVFCGPLLVHQFLSSMRWSRLHQRNLPVHREVLSRTLRTGTFQLIISFCCFMNECCIIFCKYARAQQHTTLFISQEESGRKG